MKAYFKQPGQSFDIRNKEEEESFYSRQKFAEAELSMATTLKGKRCESGVN